MAPNLARILVLALGLGHAGALTLPPPPTPDQVDDIQPGSASLSSSSSAPLTQDDTHTPTALTPRWDNFEAAAAGLPTLEEWGLTRAPSTRLPARDAPNLAFGPWGQAVISPWLRWEQWTVILGAAWQEDREANLDPPPARGPRPQNRYFVSRGATVYITQWEAGDAAWEDDATRRLTEMPQVDMMLANMVAARRSSGLMPQAHFPTDGAAATYDVLGWESVAHPGVIDAMRAVFAAKGYRTDGPGQFSFERPAHVQLPARSRDRRDKSLWASFRDCEYMRRARALLQRYKAAMGDARVDKVDLYFWGNANGLSVDFALYVHLIRPE